MDVYLIQFGETLEKIRRELCLTQKDVSLSSGINTETLRRIENGKVVPRFETLECLSTTYKQDLNSLFLKYRIDDFSYFYELKNRLEGKFDRDEFYTLNIELKELKMLFDYTHNSFYKILITQLILLTESVILYKECNNYNESLTKLIEAIRITSSYFNLDHYNEYTYSTIEIRILMNMAFIFNKLNNKEKYQEIMEFCINSVDSNSELYPKLCHNLAGVYRRNKDFKKALEYSNIGIKACQENRLFNGLSLLYYGKGIAEYSLNNDEYLESIRTSLYLCKAFGQDKLKTTIMHNCKEVFGIDL